jgi:hypothetical protein
MTHRSQWILLLLGALGSAWLFATHSQRRHSSETILSIENAAASEPWKPLDGPNYYVSNAGSDSRNGSFSHPWATIQHAASVAGPGATIHVLPGIYEGRVVTKKSGQADARIRFLSEEKWRARVVTAEDAAAWTNYGAYVDIAGFDVSGSGAYGILNYASNVRIIGNHVHDIPAAGCTSDGGAGIDNAEYSAHDDDIISNVVVRIGDPGRICNRVQGIYHSNLRGHIWNNISCDNQGWGIHLWHAPQSVIISNNLVCRNGQGGIVIGAGDSSGVAPADHMLVTNNILFANGRPGPGYAIEEFGSVGNDNHYISNLIFDRQQRVSLKNSNVVTGVIWKDPQFVDYLPNDSADYHLSARSPAIGAGTPAGAPPYDLEGKARPVSGRWDIGPYAYQSQGKPWPWY